MSLNEKRKSWIIVDDIDTWTPPSVKRIESLRTTESIISKIKDEDIQFYNAWLKDNKKVNVNWRNKFDDYKTPLISAIRNKKNNISGLLLKLPDIDITIRSASGWNAFDYALAKGNSEAVSQLVGVSGINFQYEDGSTQLILAVRHGDPAGVLQILLFDPDRIDLHIRNKEGHDAFDVGINSVYPDCVALLLIKEVYPDLLQDIAGKSAWELLKKHVIDDLTMTARSTGVGELLVASSSFNEVSTVKALLDKFGDEILQAKTKTGYTCLEVVILNNHLDLALFLSERGALITSKAFQKLEMVPELASRLFLSRALQLVTVDYEDRDGTLRLVRGEIAVCASGKDNLKPYSRDFMYGRHYWEIVDDSDWLAFIFSSLKFTFYYNILGWGLKYKSRKYIIGVPQVNMKAFRTPVDGMASYKAIKMYVRIADQLQTSEFFSCSSIGAAVEFAWVDYGRDYHYFMMAIYVAMLILNSFINYNFSDWVSSSQGDLSLATDALIAIIAMNGFFLGIEAIQLIKAPFSYLTSLSNLFDVASHGTLILGSILRLFNNEDSQQSTALISIATIFLWINLLYYFRPFEFSSAVVRMLYVDRLLDMYGFVTILMFILFGFSQALYILSPKDDEHPFGHSSIAYLNAYGYMMNIGSTLTIFEGTENASLGQFELVLLVAVCTIFLLNVLIAIIGNSYSKIRANVSSGIQLEKCKVMLDQVHLNIRIPRGLRSLGESYTPREYLLFSALRNAVGRFIWTWSIFGAVDKDLPPWIYVVQRLDDHEIERREKESRYKLERIDAKLYTKEELDQHLRAKHVELLRDFEMILLKQREELYQSLEKRIDTKLLIIRDEQAVVFEELKALFQQQASARSV